MTNSALSSPPPSSSLPLPVVASGKSNDNDDNNNQYTNYLDNSNTDNINNVRIGRLKRNFFILVCMMSLHYFLLLRQESKSITASSNNKNNDNKNKHDQNDFWLPSVKFVVTDNNNISNIEDQGIRLFDDEKTSSKTTTTTTMMKTNSKEQASSSSTMTSTTTTIMKTNNPQEDPANTPTNHHPRSTVSKSAAAPPPTTKTVPKTPAPLPTASHNNNDNNLTAVTTPTALSNTTELYLQRNCDLTGTTWYPRTSKWQRRMPYALILGSKKAGTTSLFEDLISQHSLFEKAWRKELYYYTNVGNNFETKHVNGTTGKVKVQQARAQLYNHTGSRPTEYFPQYAIWLKKNQQQQQQSPQQNPQQNHSFPYFIDATPDLLHMPNMTKHVFCVTPWVKLIVILRNPLKRAFSDYEFNFQGINAKRKNRGMEPIPRYSFEKAFEQDLKLLISAGVFPTRNNNENESENHDTTSMSHSDRMMAWNQYLQNPGGTHILGRSLYEPQLQVWFDALRQLGYTSPMKNHIHIVRTEDLKSNFEETIQGVYEFLGVTEGSKLNLQKMNDGNGNADANANATATTTTKRRNLSTPQKNNTKAAVDGSKTTKQQQQQQLQGHHAIKNNYKGAILNNTTKQMLEDLFRPYTKRLYDLLIKEGYGEGWKDFWEEE